MSNEREVFERTLTRLLIEQHKPDFERFGFEYMDGDTLTAYKMFQAGAEWQRTQAQPADALVEALEQLLSEVEGFNVSGVYFTEKCLGHKGYISAIAALDTYRAAQEKK